jgi:hypothetical protein
LNNHLNVLQWLRAQDPPCPWSEKTCDTAAYGGHLNVLQWLRAQDPPCPWDIKTCLIRSEIISTNLEIQEWIKSQIVSVDLIKETSSTIEILEDDICSICYTPNTNVQTTCLHNYHYECLNTWFHKKETCPYCVRVLEKCFEKTV